MSALREAVLLQMRLRGFAANTVDAYIHAMEELWKFLKRPLDRLTCEEVQRFLDEIITVRKRAWATVNVYFSAYRFLYLQVLKRPAQEFRQRLKLHFHVHCIVPGGVWRDDSKEWVPRRSRWLFREESLADAFRNRFLRRLSSLRRRGKLVYKGRAALLADEVAWEAWRASLASQSWIVFSKLPPIQHPSPKGCATRPRPGSVWTRQKTAPRDRRDANHRCPRPAKHVLDRFCCLDRFANPCPTHPAA